MKCPKCGSKDCYIEDESFSHDWAGGGVEIVRYGVCNSCGFDDENDDYSIEDWEVEE